MRKLTITHIDYERLVFNRSFVVQLRGMIGGIEIKVQEEVAEYAFDNPQVAVEFGIQACARKLVEALEPEEVVYETEAETFAKLHAMGPIHINSHAAGTPSGGFTYGHGYVKPEPLVISNVDVSGTSTIVLNNAAQTATTK